ncbi:hypothetical protein N665_0209s0004 [Sinapis alba]|nr:hypothetical protein N665_0209s0004 [Sinapis alba]
MTRKKVKLAFIVNNSSRKATYKKRKRGLLKKMNELSTLCGISVGAIIYSPYDPNPVVWPSVDGMHQVISNFRRLPEIDQQKNMVNQVEFLQQRITKATNHLMKQMRENREEHLTEVMFQLLGNVGQFPILPKDLNDLGYIVDQHLNNVKRRIEILQGSEMEIGGSSNAVGTMDPSVPVGTLTLGEGATAPATTVHGVGSSSSSAAGGASLLNQMYHLPQPQPQQQFYQPFAPYAGFYEQSRNQNQFMEMMDHTDHRGYAANQMGYPFMDNTHHYHHQPQQPQFFPGESSAAPQQQLFPGESSAAPPPATSGSVTPATTPNPTNNIWFH